jgi:hypothetical protein
MKNQFNKITQGIFEAFKGPRTKDFEYDKMVQEYQFCKDRIVTLKSVLDSYPSRLEGYKTSIDDLISSCEVIFEGDKSMYHKFITDVVLAHKALNEKLTNMFQRVESLKGETDKWTQNCSTVDEKINFREEKRKTFDHYDEKMGDLYEERQKIFAKGNFPDEKDEEKYIRNIKKYKDAANEYVVATNDAYKFICYFIDSKYENISKNIAEFLDIELIFFHEARNIFNYFQNIKRNVLTIKQSFIPPKRNYDASNFIRAKSLLNVNVEDLMKSSTNISGIIEGTGKPVNLNENKTKNEFYRTPSFNNSNKKETPLLNPYIDSDNKPFSNFYSSNIGNSNPFQKNNVENNNNPFINNNYPQQPEQKKNPYSEGSSGENPFDKPNI